MSERRINDFFREFMQMVLTDTKTFGDDGNSTFDEKREYYLYYFPKREIFNKTIRENKELRENPTVRRLLSMGDVYPTIKLPRSGKMTPTMKASIRRDLNSLLYSKNLEVMKFGKDLFMYSFYHDGFDFKGDSFGTYFDATFWNAFPEVIYKLRTFKYDSEHLNSLIQKFKMQWLANHAQEDIIRVYQSQQSPVIYNEDGSVSLRQGNCFNVWTAGTPSKYMRVPKEKGSKEYQIFELDLSSWDANEKNNDHLLIYRLLPLFDEPSRVYNAHDNAFKM